MATALIVTWTTTKGGEAVNMTSQTIMFVTPQAARKALTHIVEETAHALGKSVVVSGTIVGDVII